MDDLAAWRSDAASGAPGSPPPAASADGSDLGTGEPPGGQPAGGPGAEPAARSAGRPDAGSADGVRPDPPAAAWWRSGNAGTGLPTRPDASGTDSGRTIADRSRATLRLLRPPPEHVVDQRLGTTAEHPPQRPPLGGVLGLLDRFQRRHPLVGFPLAVVYKFADDQGAFLAASLTFYAFVSLFPLLLLLLSISGFVLHGDPDLRSRLLDSALRDVPIIGDDLRDNLAVRGNGFGLLVGVFGTIYGSLGLAQAAQTVFNRLNGVPRNTRPNPIRSRLRSLRVIPLFGFLLVVSSALSAVPVQASIGSFSLGSGLHLAAIVVATGFTILLFTLAFRQLQAHRPRFREVLIGAVLAGVAWQALQFGGAVFITDHFSHASEVGGVFAIVLGGITYLYLEALVVVFCAEVNVVLHRRLWPRALMTPFTDDVDLTPADRRAYASYAQAERFKGFEQIDVDFDHVAPPRD